MNNYFDYTTCKLSDIFKFSSHIKNAYRNFETSILTCKKRKNQFWFLRECLQEQVVCKSFGFKNNLSVLGDPFPKYLEFFLLDKIRVCKIEIDESYFKSRTAYRSLCSTCHSHTLLKLQGRRWTGTRTEGRWAGK